MGQETGKTNTSEEKKQGAERAAFVPLWVAVVTGIVTIAVALISSPLFEKWLEPDPTPFPIVLISTNTPFATEVVETIPPSQPPPTMDVITPIVVTTIAPDLSSPTFSVASEMFVRIAASQTSGKAPLTVKFDARDSYVQAPDGTIFECSRGACRYSWYILLNGQEFDRPDTDRGTLDFRFQQEGIYSISVYICHGSDSPTCGNGATLVIVD
jgi:hypothetical protein